jgi:thiamine biosynthesis lipoprotein
MTILLEFEAIGTSWSIQAEIVDQDTQQEIKTSLQAEIESVVNTYDKLYSRFRNDSTVAEIRQHTCSGNKSSNQSSTKNSWEFPSHARDLFSFYTKMEEVTGGLFTASIGHSLEEIGYDSMYSLGNKKYHSKKVKTQDSLRFNDLTITYKDESVLLSIPSQPTTSTAPLVLDFGAAGKGQLVDLISQTLGSHYTQPTSFTVNGSGDIFHQGNSAITVGLENPYNEQTVIGTVQIQNQALCGSASNRRTWQVGSTDFNTQSKNSQTTYHHILNPHTLESPTHIAASWVIAQTTLEADGLATGLFLVPAPILLDAFDFEYLILYTTGRVEKSPGFIAEMYV